MSIVAPGDPLKILASEWNEVQEILRWWKGNRIQLLAKELQSDFKPSVVWVKNTTTTDRDAFDVLAISDLLVDVRDYEAEKYNSLHLLGVAPTTDYGRWCVLQEPAAANSGFARAILAGVTLAKLNITHASDAYCELANGITGYLTTGALGSARILLKNSGTGSSNKWGVIRIGDPSGEILVYNATGSDIAAGASGTFTVYTGTPGSEASTGQTLTAFNRSSIAFKNAKYGSAALLNGQAYAAPQQT